jgi:hypothetical protein
MMEFRQWEGLLRRRLITVPHRPLATLQLFRHDTESSFDPARDWIDREFIELL